MYTYIISKTNEISFTTDPLVIEYCELMYRVTLWFLLSSPCQTWWWPYNKRAETSCLSFDSLHLNKVLLCFDLTTLSIAISKSVFRRVCFQNNAASKVIMIYLDMCNNLSTFNTYTLTIITLRFLLIKVGHKEKSDRSTSPIFLLPVIFRLKVLLWIAF